MYIRNSCTTFTKVFLALAVAISGVVAIPTAVQAESTIPTSTVSKTSGLNPNGELVTISGTGFIADGTLTNGTRPPLIGTFSGFYVSFGKFQDVWKPSVSAPSGNRKSSQSDASRTNWLVPAANLATIGGAAAGGVVLNPDGTFSITLNTSDVLLSSANALIFDTSTIGNYGIYTYGASGANYAPFETYTPLTFAPRVTSTPVVSIPVVVNVPENAKIVTSQIKFGSGEKLLSRSNKKKLNADLLKYSSASKIVITGTASSTVGASDKTVKRLAMQRANVIKKYLVAKGVTAEKIIIKTKIAKQGEKLSVKVVASP